jgi:hypothetical protein
VIRIVHWPIFVNRLQSLPIIENIFLKHWREKQFAGVPFFVNARKKRGQRRKIG